MWTRKQLKERGKKAFKANYWKSVLVALIFAVVAGGAAGGGNYSSGGFPTASGVSSGMVQEADGNVSVQDEDGDVKVDLDDDSIKVDVTDNDSDDEVSIDVDEETGKADIKVNGETVTDKIVADGLSNGAIVAMIIVGAIVGLIVFTIIMAIGFAISAFLLNPFEMGCNRFFYRNLEEPAKLTDVVYAFDHNYINIVKNLFFRDLYVTLWSFLFVIPGIIKAYEYRMIPYLMQDNPDMSKEEVFAKSKEMMTGQKWNAFVLDLSFIGWHILSIFTCGLLSIFYVNPYKDSTNAALYEALKLGNSTQEEVVYEA